MNRDVVKCFRCKKVLDIADTPDYGRFCCKECDGSEQYQPVNNYGNYTSWS